MGPATSAAIKAVSTLLDFKAEGQCFLKDFRPIEEDKSFILQL
jgi:hypothetical protein